MSRDQEPETLTLLLRPQVGYDQGQDIAERLTRSRSTRTSASEKQYGGVSGGKRDGGGSGGGGSDATKDHIINRVKSASRATRTSPRQ